MADIAAAPRPGPGPAPLSHGRLEHFPVTFFAIVMGLMGLALAVHAASKAYGLGHQAFEVVLAAAVGSFALILLGYLAKALRHPAAMAAEWAHPVRIAFFPAISISTLLLATALLPVAPGVADWVWMLGVAAQGALALAVIGAWIGHRPFQTPHLSPAWFIPAVGNVIVPIAGVPLGHVELSWLFFSAGLMFWVVLLTLVVNRLMFHEPMPGKLAPTLTILIAPPAVAYVAWLRLAGEPGAFGHILLSLGYVFALIVLMQVGRFRGIPFALSWWALSFPVAALSIASFAHAGAAQSEAHRLIGAGLLALLAAIVAFLLARTLYAIATRGICVPE
ncbi:SLAC1 anion channel family protein [Rubrimonas cliftonensis]|uniref:Tellurite resistance protein n=1 Tax=Rubrimonas cliftonensis TaxID=89524 RepID=A0A1H3YG77_9RHOB|nr:SLAC1 anion channel family protein [Rubrimonas cliftonensis]SEA10014.1 tellurite resistance protein [Rubrimonas cliftonensis]